LTYIQRFEQRSERTNAGDRLGEPVELALNSLQLRAKLLNLARNRAWAHGLKHTLEDSVDERPA
jgi:hypothetical protein